MSHQATYWAMQVEAPTPAAKLVLILLADAHNGHTGDCFPSIARIVKASGYSESSVKYAIRDLENAGLLTRASVTDESGRTKGVRYSLNLPDGRGQNVTPGGQKTEGEGSECDPTRGQNVTPHKDNRENKPGNSEPGKTARATRLPPDWSAPPDFIEFAINEGLTRDEIRNVERVFRDHWISAREGLKRDWLATWRNWVRRDAPRIVRSRKADPHGNGRQGGGVIGAYQRAAAFVQASHAVPVERADVLDL